MKKMKLTKKFGVTMLSLASALALSVSAITTGVANAAYDYTQTAKTDDYLKGLFSTNSSVTVQAGYTAPDYLGLTSENNNGVLIDLATGVEVKSTRTYKVSELSNVISFVPVVDESKVGTTTDIKNFEVVIYEESNGAIVKSVTYSFNATAYNWHKDGASSLAVAGKTVNAANDGEVLEQTPAGYAWSSANAVPQEQKHYMRKQSNAFRVFAGFAGTSITTASKKYDRVISLGYEETGDAVNTYCTPYDGALSGKSDSIVRNLKQTTFLTIDDECDNSTAGTVTNELATSMNALISDCAFDGFSADADIHIKFSATNGSGKILVTSLGGEDLSSPIRVADGYKGYVNKEFNIPAAKLYVNNKAGETFSGKYTIYDTDGTTKLVDSADYTSGANYTFNKSGKFNIVYSHTDDGGKKYEGTYVAEIYTEAELGKLELTCSATASKFDKTVGMSFNVGATVSSPVYFGADKSTVSLKITKPDATVDDLGTITAEKMYTFTQNGTYTLTYTAIDAVSTETKTVTIDVARAYYALEQMDYSVWSYGDTYNKITIDRDVVAFYDYAYGRNFYNNASANVNMTIKVKVPGATDYVELNANELENGYAFAKGVFGEYNFKYSLSYKVDETTYYIPAQNQEIEFTVNVIDSSAPTIFLVGNDYLTGASKVSESDKNINYQAITGSTVTFGKIRAFDEIGSKYDYTNDIKLSLVKDGVAEDITAQYNANRNAFTQTFATTGTYMYKFDVTDGFNTSYICINVEVKDEFYSISSSASFKDVYNTDQTVTASAFDVLNSKGNVATDVTKEYVVTRNGATVYSGATLNYSPEKSGTYVITLKASKGSEVVAEQTYTFTAEDKSAPVITINGTIMKEAKVGDKVSVASIVGVDNESAAADVVNSITVTLNGAEVNIFQNQFTPTEAGVYKVKLTSTDLNGNVATYVYEINVKAVSTEATVLGMPVWSFILGIVGVVALAGAVATYFVVYKKSRKSAK